MGCHFLLQGMFPTQGLTCISYTGRFLLLSHLGRDNIQWEAAVRACYLKIWQLMPKRTVFSRVWGQGITGFHCKSFNILFEFNTLPCSSVGKESACNAGDPGSIPGLGRSPGEGNGNPLQYSCLENLMDRGAWWATVHGVARVGHDLATKRPPP